MKCVVPSCSSMTGISELQLELLLGAVNPKKKLMRQVTSLPSLCLSSSLTPVQEIHVGFVSAAVA